MDAQTKDFWTSSYDTDLVAYDMFLRGRIERENGNYEQALALFELALDVLRGSRPVTH